MISSVDNARFESANYYVSSAGAAHVCMLDASKAFDRVNLLTLFK